MTIPGFECLNHLYPSAEEAEMEEDYTPYEEECPALTDPAPAANRFEAAPPPHICVHCHLDPPDGGERPSAYNNEWLHPRCEKAFIDARLAEEGLLRDEPTGASDPAAEEAEEAKAPNRFDPASVTALRLQLRKNGFDSIPVEGKRPPLKGWQQKFDVSEEEIRRWEKTFPRARNTGVLAKRTPGTDIDIAIEAAAQAAEDKARELLEEHGDIYVRFGKPPKRLILLRTDEPFKKLYREFRAPDGSKQRLEILGDGQQYVVDGIHPDTHKPYTCFGGELTAIKRENLPYIRREDAEQLLDAMAKVLIEEHGFVLIGTSKTIDSGKQLNLTRKSASGNGDETPDRFEVAAGFKGLPVEDLGEGIEENHRWDQLSGEHKDAALDHGLECIAKNSDLLKLGNNENWYRLAMSVARSGAPHLESIFVKYAGAVPNADSEKELRKKLADCKKDPRGITVATFIWWARQYGANFEPWFGARKGNGEDAGQQRNDGKTNTSQQKLTATPHVWRDPTTIPPRDFLYGNHIIRGYVTSDVSMGGVGKTSEGQVEIAAMVTGRDLLGVAPKHPYRAWYINLEDPQEEIDRRFAAIFKHYGITEHELGNNRLYTDSGRKKNFVVAREDKTGIKFDKQVIADIENTIRENAIDFVVVDPFVNCARFAENDNNKMAAIIETVWAAIAERQNCAVLLEHHVRKGAAGSDGYTVEDARGAGALINSCRSIRVFNTMTKADGEKAGVERHRSYFRIDSGKVNLTPPPEESEWRKFVSVPLGNAMDDCPEDWIGVVTRWEWPDPMKDLTVADLRSAQKAVSEGGPWRANSQAKDWVGIPIATALRLDPDSKADRAKIKGALKIWIRNGMFREVEGEDAKRMKKTFVEVGTWADQKVETVRMKPSSQKRAIRFSRSRSQRLPTASCASSAQSWMSAPSGKSGTAACRMANRAASPSACTRPAPRNGSAGSSTPSSKIISGSKIISDSA